jgi:hypothetical protein
MTRGSVSKTLPEVCAYDVGSGGPKPSATVPAARKTGVVRRGKTSSAAPILPRPATRLLQEPSTVRSPKESSGLDSWLGPVPTSAPQGPVAEVCRDVGLSDLDLCEDVREVGRRDREPLTHRGRLGRRRRPWRENGRDDREGRYRRDLAFPGRR